MMLMEIPPIHSRNPYYQATIHVRLSFYWKMEVSNPNDACPGWVYTSNMYLLATQGTNEPRIPIGDLIPAEIGFPLIRKEWETQGRGNKPMGSDKGEAPMEIETILGLDCRSLGITHWLLLNMASEQQE